MLEKKTVTVVAEVESAEDAKEFLDNLETLSDKYELLIDLKICRESQALYTLT